VGLLLARNVLLEEGLPVSLDCSANPSLGDAGAVLLLPCLERLRSLRSVSLAHCGLADAGLAAVARLVRRNKVQGVTLTLTVRSCGATRYKV
jgi:hypothetical protein